MTDAEVVERDLDPEITRRRDFPRRAGDVMQDRGLGDFDTDVAGIASGFFENPCELFCRLRARELSRRNVAPKPKWSLGVNVRRRAISQDAPKNGIIERQDQPR